MRKLKRSVAYAKMQKDGITKINKHWYVGAQHQREVQPSYFAMNWRDYIYKEV